MSAVDDMERGGSVQAAEFALGLLEGEELLVARGRMASDGAFAAEVIEWQNRLAPLLDEVAPMVPSAELWARIEARIAAARDIGNATGQTGMGASNVVELQSRLRRWKWTAALTSAAAAIALAFLAFAPGTDPASVPGGGAGPSAPIASADPLVAQVPIGDTGLRLDVTYIPESEKMVVAAIGLTPDGVHDHELWLVPKDGGELQSLGVVAPGEVHSMKLPDEIARNLDDGVGLVLTREPIGGKPEGADAGPVVAEGKFSRV